MTDIWQDNPESDIEALGIPRAFVKTDRKEGFV